MDSSAYFFIALVVMLAGLLGTLFPGIPGVPLVWLGLVLFAVLDRLQHLSLPGLVVLTLIAAVGTTAGFWGTQLWTRAGGGSGCASMTGSCLLVLGLVFFTLPYALLLALLGVFGVEWRRRSSARLAALSSSAWLIGWLFSTIVEFVSALVIILLFLQFTLAPALVGA
ncbi:MAG: DUF456 family protein [Rudaea sp.]